MPIKPYRGRSKDRLTAIINAQNTTPRVEGVDFEYGPVQVWSGPIDSNTRVILTPIPQDVYIGPVPITYKRRAISILMSLPPTERRTLVIQNFPFTTHGIISEINDAYGLDLVVGEIENISYQTDSQTVTLRILAGNYAWLPSEVELPASYVYDISTIVANPLTGFENPTPTEIDTIIGNVLSGFDNQDIIDIVNIINNPLSGFENQDLIELSSVINNPLSGFDNPNYVPDLGFAYLVNGLYQADDLFIVTELEGFY